MALGNQERFGPRDKLGSAEQTPRGHDLGLLEDMLALTPIERIRTNARWVALIEKLRAGLDDDGRRDDPPVPG